GNDASFSTAGATHLALSHHQGGASASTPFTPDSGTSHHFGIGRASDGVTFFEAGTSVAMHAPSSSPAGSLHLLLSNDAGLATGGPVYDWVRIRPWIEPEPTVTLDPEEQQYGVLPARWRYRKIYAFRTDGFAD